MVSKVAERRRLKLVSGEKGLAGPQRVGGRVPFEYSSGNQTTRRFALRVLSGASGTLCEEGGIQTSLFTTNFTPLKF